MWPFWRAQCDKSATCGVLRPASSRWVADLPPAAVRSARSCRSSACRPGRPGRTRTPRWSLALLGDEPGERTAMRTPQRLDELAELLELGVPVYLRYSPGPE